jgi:hypothetical protein
LAFRGEHVESGAVALVRHEFGAEGAAYVRSYLQANERFNKRLGRLLARRDIASGTTWGLVPSEAPPDRRSAFDDSLFPPSTPPIKVERGFMVANFVPAESPQIREAVRALLEKPGGTALLVIEHAFSFRSDFKLPPDQSAHQVFFCGDDVYEYALADSPLDEAIRMLGGAIWRPEVGLVAALPDALDTIEHGQSLRPEQLEQMVERAAAVIFGAWDDDSLLFWEPGSI